MSLMYTLWKTSSVAARILILPIDIHAEQDVLMDLDWYLGPIIVCIPQIDYWFATPTNEGGWSHL